MIKRFVIVGILLAVVFGGLAVFQYVLKPKLIAEFVAGLKPPPVTISATKAKLMPWQPTLTSIGTLEAIRGVSVSPLVGGRVQSIHFKSGQQVTVGTLLITLDDSIEQAQLKEAQSALKLSELDYQRGLELYQKQNYAKASLDKARAQRDQNEAKVESLRATIKQKKIHAPFTGRLGIRQVNLGQYLSAGDPIVPLQSLQPIYVDFGVPQQDAASIRKGTAVRVTPGGTGGGGEDPMEGKVTALNSVVDPSTRNVQVQATFDNPGDTLKPGMFVEAQVDLGAPTSAVTLPATAISFAPYGDSVFVVEQVKSKDGSSYLGVRQQFVKLGASRGDQVAVLSGVKPGEEVATSGVFKLHNGAAVYVNNEVTPENNPAPQPKDS